MKAGSSGWVCAIALFAGCAGAPSGVSATSGSTASTSSSGSSTGGSTSASASTGTSTTSSTGSASSSTGGSVEVSTYAGDGNANEVNGYGGPDGGAEFGGAGQLAFDAAGNLYVADIVYVRSIRPNLQVGSVAGNGGYGFADGPIASALFDQIASVAVGLDGSIYVADDENERIRKIDLVAGTVITLAGDGNFGDADGPATSAEFEAPVGVAADAQGNIYVADEIALSVRKIDPAGSVTTLAGGGGRGDADGTGGVSGTAGFAEPVALAVDEAGNVFVADGNRVRKLDPSGNVTTVAGNGTCGAQDGTGGRAGSAEFCGVSAIAVDNAGYLVVTDSHRVRAIGPFGDVTTLAGDGHAGFRDGPGPQAEFTDALGIAVDATGAIFVGDYTRIRKLVRTP